MDQKYYTLPEKLTEVIKQSPSKIALQIKKGQNYERYTYSDLYNNALAIAQSLVDLGIKKGDRVAIVLENRPEWGFIYFGILFAGAITIPLDPQATIDDLKYFLENSASKIVFTSPKFRGTVTKAITNLQKIVMLDSKESTENILPFAHLLDNSERSLIKIKTSPNDTASILYTSGTTGKPKGVMLSHNNFYSNFQGIEKLDIFAEEHNFLAILPLHHSFPFMATLLIPLFSHNKITYITNLKQQEITQSMRETSVTILVGVPQIFYLFYQTILNKIKNIPFYIRLPLLGLISLNCQLKKLIKINLNKLALKKIHAPFGKHLKYFVCGGAKLDQDVEAFLNKVGFTLVQGYGLTETSPVVTFNPIKKMKPGSVGQPLPNVKIKIVNPDAKGIGEVVISGPNVMQGYFRLDQETQKVLKDNWFYSGDLGYLDNKGYLFLTGRKKELIVLGSGKNISPQEVEKHYLKSPYFQELAVTSIGEGTKEKLAAVILPNFEHFKKMGEININEIIKSELDLLAKNYPPYKRIMKFVITKKELPKTRLGKLKRHKIKEEYSQDFYSQKKDEYNKIEEGDLAIISSSTYQTIVQIITTKKSFKKPLHINDHLGLDLGFDSLSRIELLASLEKEFNINITESLMAQISTIKELIQTIDKLIVEQKHDSTHATAHPEKNMWQKIIKTDPNKTMANKIDLSPNYFARIFSLLIGGGLLIITKLMWRIKISGKENLPKNKPFILCPNHASFLDAFLIAATIPNWLKQTVFFLGYHIYFDVPIIRNLVKLGRIIPVDPTANLVETMRACGYVLRHQKPICIFPEGVRSPDGSLQNFKSGIGILAHELNIPLVPTYIDGSFKALPRGNSLPKFNQIKISFGKPLSPQELQEKGKNLGAQNNYEAIARGLREEVEKLSPNN